jgi:hypothetical protein
VQDDAKIRNFHIVLQHGITLYIPEQQVKEGRRALNEERIRAHEKYHTTVVLHTPPLTTTRKNARHRGKNRPTKYAHED